MREKPLRFWTKQAADASGKPLFVSDATNTPGRRPNELPRDPARVASTAFRDQQRLLEAATPSVKIGARKLHRRLKFRGLDISIETDKGRFRFWHDPHTGRDGKTKMQYPYGYIRGTVGMDGDHVDVFVGPNEDAFFVYVITTNKAPDFKEVDEQKCMLGFDNADDAKAAFHAHYNDVRFFREMKTLPFSEFKDKALKTPEGTKKIAAGDLVHPHPRGRPPEFWAPQQGAAEEAFIGLRDPGPTRHIINEPLDREDRVDRAFRFHDQPQHSTAIEGGWGAPSSDTVP